MALQPIAAKAKDLIAAIDKIMRERQIQRVPVIDADRRVVGVVSVNDLARAALAHETGQREVSLHDVVSTLAEITRPRISLASDDARPHAA